MVKSFDPRQKILDILNENNVKIDKVKGMGKIGYKINGLFVYFTFSKNLGSEEKPKYFLQVNKNKIDTLITKNINFSIFLICGNIDNTFVISKEEFLRFFKDFKTAKDGNWKINIIGIRRQIKIEQKYTLKLKKDNEFDITPLLNNYSKLELRDEVKNSFLKLLDIYKKEGFQEIFEKDIPLYPIKIKFKKETRNEVNISKIMEIAKSGKGTLFESLVKEIFRYFGFEIDDEISGKNGELDVICISPLAIGIECRSTKGNVGVNILDELNRHIRRYKEKNKIERIYGLIICDTITKQLSDDSITEGAFIIDIKTLSTLFQYSLNNYFSPLDFEKFFTEAGNISNKIMDFIQNNERRIALREQIIGVLKEKKRGLQPIEIKTILESKGWRIEVLNKELEQCLIELSSPLIGYIEKENDKYSLVWDEKYDKHKIESLKRLDEVIQHG